MRPLKHAVFVECNQTNTFYQFTAYVPATSYTTVSSPDFPPPRMTSGPTRIQNAGHVAQGIRPASYHALTDTSNYHVLAIDYRGFGHSSGSPTEAGLASTPPPPSTGRSALPACRPTG